jgi:hypothetical protein
MTQTALLLHSASDLNLNIMTLLSKLAENH